MVTVKNLNVDLEPYTSLVERKYVPYFILVYQIYSFISIIVLLDYLHEQKIKRSIKTGIFLCFITSVNVGLSLFFLLLYFNVCL
ncbi:conserved Plasmodium protein, unknown function [Plasmodium malariae]|uniref:Dolichyl-diphosphooligosaccharide-protein glycosyltransferase subunit OST5 n=1 Tax=Plasmodium malariae TaxID=5858 RepID=A0A1D3TFN1_PLAMA|nr:conserved Plasmodium protein, unknown function [Plasmodium malariae]SCP03704.1 conserved Plasmodium protein, unknown function [Plasmodium malariae]